MDNNNLIKSINLANHFRYNNGKIVDQYLKEAYHKERTKIALSLLTKELDTKYPNVRKEQIRIMDLGCGSGEISKIISEFGYSVIAVDNSDVSINSYDKKNIPIIIFDANQIFPVQDNSYHAIYCGELIEHIFNIKKFLAECNRILKLNGVLIITTPNLASLQDRIFFIFGISPRHVNPLHDYLWLHIRQFTARSLKSVLISQNFSKVIIKSNYVKFYLIRGKKIQIKFLAKMFPSLGGSLICSSIKSK